MWPGRAARPLARLWGTATTDVTTDGEVKLMSVVVEERASISRRRWKINVMGVITQIVS